MKIGMCFPIYDYNELSLKKLKEYILELKNEGVSNFDMYSSFVCDFNNDLDDLFEFLNKNEITISFHYLGGDSLLEYENAVSTVRNRMKAANMNYSTTMVFHAPNYKNEHEKYEILKKAKKRFNDLAEFADDYNIQILIETLSHYTPEGNHLGDDIDELEYFITNINPNLGICWDIGHTRLNHIQRGDYKYLTDKLIYKVGFTHIHSFGKKGSIYYDHQPYININQQKDEIRFLKQRGYEGIYSLEHEVKNLKENILIYKDEIKRLKKVLGGIL